MTESDWSNSTEQRQMLDFLKGRTSDRKFRLFAVACCRRAWPWMADDRSRRLVEAVENFADGHVSEEELTAAFTDGERAYGESAKRAKEAERRMLDERAGDLGAEAMCHAAGAAKWAGLPPTVNSPVSRNAGTASTAVTVVAQYARGHELGARLKNRGEPDEFADAMLAAKVAESVQLASLVRCVFGNPFRPVNVEPAWRTADAVGIAGAVYDDRAFDLLPVLADALQDAGCDEPAFLDHCRSPGPHARGCWVVDMLLGKE